MRKIFISAKNIQDHHASILGNDAYHLCRVLRKKPGDIIKLTCVTSDQYTHFLAQIQTITSQEVIVRLNEQAEEAFHCPYPVTLAQGIPKHVKMDLIVQKATELGIEEIIPLTTSYSFVNAEGNISKIRWERWQKIIQEAAKQCGRINLPLLHPSQNLQSLTSWSKDANALRLVLWEKEGQNHLHSLLTTCRTNKEIKKIILVVGPEGGFQEEEIQLLKNLNFLTASCAPWILRAETASLYALSIIQYEFNFP